jgi:hypothetical protein
MFQNVSGRLEFAWVIRVIALVDLVTSAIATALIRPRSSPKAKSTKAILPDFSVCLDTALIFETMGIFFRGPD